MNRILLSAGAALLLACAALAWVAKSQYDGAALLRQENRELTEAVERSRIAQKRADAALVSARKKNAATARETAVKQHTLEQAKAANPVWRDEPVPQEVQDALAE